MSAATRTQAAHPYVAALLAGYEPAKGGLAWLAERRARALERANALTVPTTRDEEWRFTDISPLTRVKFRRATGGGAGAVVGRYCAVRRSGSGRPARIRGRCVRAAAFDLGRVAGGMTATSLAAALATQGAVIEPHMARHVDFDSDVFAAINTSHLQDGAFVRIAGHQKGPGAGAPAVRVHQQRDGELSAVPDDCGGRRRVCVIEHSWASPTSSISAMRQPRSSSDMKPECGT